MYSVYCISDVFGLPYRFASLLILVRCSNLEIATVIAEPLLKATGLDYI